MGNTSRTDHTRPLSATRRPQNYLDARHEVTFYGISRLVLSTESETISSALNGTDLPNLHIDITAACGAAGPL